MKKFISDGCTNSPDANFRHCCEQHDAYYHDGSVSRKEADSKLFWCILKRGNPNPIGKAWYFIVASCYWAAVRVLGKSKYKK